MKILSSIEPKERPSLEEWAQEYRVGTNKVLPKCQNAIRLNSQYSFNKKKKSKLNLLELLLGVN